MRTVFVRSACGCSSPGIAAAADRDVFAKAARAQLGKGRNEPVVTTVAVYVQRKEKSLSRKVAKVLAKQRAVVIKKVLALYVEPVSELTKAEKKPPTAADIIAALESDWLADDLGGYITPAMIAAYRRGTVAGITQVGVQSMPGITEQMDEAARAYAERRGAALITELAETTRDSVRGVVTAAVEDGVSVEQLRASLEDSGAFAESRARMIARTELAFAHVQGNVEGWRASDEVEGKRAILGDLHDVADVCDECADAGVVGLDEEFADGQMFPPFHPNCVCDIEPVLRDADSE